MNENNTHPLTENRAAEIWGDHAPAYLGQWRSMSDDRRAHAVHLLRVAHNAGRAYERATNTEDDRPWVPLDGPPRVGDEVRRDFHGVTTIGLVASVDGEGDPFTAEGYLIGLRNYGTWYTRPAVLEGGGMNKCTDSNDPNVQVIENASPDDIQADDHVTWEWRREMDGVIVTERREGTAHHRDEEGSWHSKDGIWLAGAVWPWQEAPTITIRRTTPELPTEDGAVIVPADGHEFFETLAGRVDKLVHLSGKWYGGSFPLRPEQITPGAWRAA